MLVGGRADFVSSLGPAGCSKCCGGYIGCLNSTIATANRAGESPASAAARSENCYRGHVSTASAGGARLVTYGASGFATPGAAAAGAYRRVLLDWHSRHAKVPSRLLAFCGPSFLDADTTCHSRYSHLAFTSLTSLVSMSNCKINRKKDNARSDTSASGASRGVIRTSVGNPPRRPPCPRSSYAASAGTHGAAIQYQREAAVSQQQQRHQQRFSGSW